MWRPLMQINQVTRKVIFETTNPWLREIFVGKGELPSSESSKHCYGGAWSSGVTDGGAWAEWPAGPGTAGTCWIWGQPQGQGVLGHLEGRERDHKRHSQGSAVSNDLQGKVRLMTISWHYPPKPARTLVQWMRDVASWLGWSTDSQVPFPVGLQLGCATSETLSWESEDRRKIGAMG